MLAATSTPFGKVVEPFGFRRHLIDSRMGSNEANFTGLSSASTLFDQRVLLVWRDDTPFAYVEEAYLADLLR